MFAWGITMKRLFLLICALTLFLYSCGAKTLSDETSCDDILNAVLASQEGAPECDKIYRKSDGSLEEYTLSLWARGTFSKCEEFDLIDDCAMYVCSGTQTFEVDIIKAVDEGAAKELDKMLEERIKTVSAGDKAAYDPDFDKMIKSSMHYTDGKYAILLITYDTRAAKEAIDELK